MSLECVVHRCSSRASNGSRLSCGAERESSRMQFYLKSGRRQLQALVRPRPGQRMLGESHGVSTWRASPGGPSANVNHRVWAPFQNVHLVLGTLKYQ